MRNDAISKADSADQKNQLFVVDEKTYGKMYNAHLIEQYKLCVEMADRVSERRNNTNSFFLTLNGVLITAIGILAKIGSSNLVYNFFWVVVASVAGVIFCWCWVTTINCYRKLNSAKFEVINTIEKKLPASSFDTEWKQLNAEDKKGKYPQLTNVERWIPIVFSFLYIALLTFAVLLIVNPSIAQTEAIPQ